MDTYGSRARHFAEILEQSPAGGERISPAAPHLWAELDFAIRHEMAIETEDFTRRRTDLGLSLAAAGVAMPRSLDAWQLPAVPGHMAAAPPRGPSLMQRSAT